ncbi:MAG: 3,4-dihydroxy-2-butanone-4-phosphate synthase [Proteobacteria bacterium]|nr:3,4-dihydroxy-2-butanone-4-phosphate synthase [Pseudomonadota bacterium]
MNNHTFASVEMILDDIRQGKMFILVDDEQRENEGDIVIAAEKITPEHINFLCQYARGLVCLSMQESDFTRLQIPMMTERNRSKLQTAFGVSIEAARGVGTGISAYDRAHTIQIAANKHSGPEDIVIPGHIFPLKAKDGGVLARQGHTEGSVDLVRLAGCNPAAVICEIMNPDGAMARLPDLIEFARHHQMHIISISQVLRYRMQIEQQVALGVSVPLPTAQWGMLTLQTFQSPWITDNYFAVIKTPIYPDKPCLVRIHSQCITGDIFGSQRCDCGLQLNNSLTRIAEEGGVLLYLPQEGRGIGFANKIRAYELQDQGMDTVEANHHLGFAADERDYSWAAQMLKALNITQVRLLTNNPHKINNLQEYGMVVTERVSLETPPVASNLNYLKTKREKLGHLLS